MIKLFNKALLSLAALSLGLVMLTTGSAKAYTSSDAPDGDLSVSLTTVTNPSAEGDPYEVKVTITNKGPAIAAVSGASVRLILTSNQLTGIELAAGADTMGWVCEAPTYNADYKQSRLSCTYSGDIGAGQVFSFNVVGKVQDCGFIETGYGGGDLNSFTFLRANVSGTSNYTDYVYNDTDTANNDPAIISDKSDWCNATDEKITSVDEANKKIAAADAASADSSSTTKVPSTGFSSLSTSLMIILAGSALTGASLFAVNKMRR